GMAGVRYVRLAGFELREGIRSDLIAKRAEIEMKEVEARAELDVVLAAVPGDRILQIEIVVPFVAKIRIGNGAEALAAEGHSRESACERARHLQADVLRTGGRIAKPRVAGLHVVGNVGPDKIIVAENHVAGLRIVLESIGHLRQRPARKRAARVL